MNTNILIKALQRICDPIWYMQEKAKQEGYNINGIMASQLSNDPSYLKSIAREALEAIKGK